MRSGIDLIVLRFWVTSSPISPSPRVAPRTNAPFSYTREIASPSIFGSVTYSMSSLPDSLRTRASHVRSSSGLRALASDSIGCRCLTGSNLSSGFPPTR
jgi:hypothetical protein